MRAYQFLLEYDRSKTEANFGSKIVAIARRDRTIPAGFRDAEQVSDEDLFNTVITTIEESDPTRNKEYAQALANLYSKGGVRFEDLGSTVADYIAKFHKLKQKRMIPSPRNDFMRYTDISDFMGVVDEYPDPNQEQLVDKGQSRVFYEDNSLRIVMPADQTAACYYGQGTRWCTAAKTNNMFRHYSQQGQLYIILPKKPKYAGEKYQFHFESRQFMDEQDRSVDLRKVVANYPSLKTAFEDIAIETSTVDLMTTETARKFVAQSKQYLEQNAKWHGDRDIMSFSMMSHQSDELVNTNLGQKIYAATGVDLHDREINLFDAGDVAWVLVDTKTGDTAVVRTDFDYGDSGYSRTFTGGSGDDWRPEFLAVVEKLADILSTYMNRHRAENDTWSDDEEELERQYSDDGDNADDLLDKVFEKYGAYLE